MEERTTTVEVDVFELLSVYLSLNCNLLTSDNSANSSLLTTVHALFISGSEAQAPLAREAARPIKQRTIDRIMIEPLKHYYKCHLGRYIT